MSKRGRSENPNNATDAQLEEFYNNTSNGKESGLYYDPFTKSYKKMFKESAGGLVRQTKYNNFLNKMKMGNQSQANRAEVLSDQTSRMRQRIMEAGNPRKYYKDLRENFINNERLMDNNVKLEEDSNKRKVENLGGRDQKKLQRNYGRFEGDTLMDIDDDTGGAGESKTPERRDDDKARDKYSQPDREGRYQKMKKNQKKKRQNRLQNRRIGGEEKVAEVENPEDVDVPGGEPGPGIVLEVQEAEDDENIVQQPPVNPERNNNFDVGDRNPRPPPRDFRPPARYNDYDGGGGGGGPEPPEPPPPPPNQPQPPVPPNQPQPPVPPNQPNQPNVPQPPAPPVAPNPPGGPPGGPPPNPPGGPPGGPPPGGPQAVPAAAQDAQLLEINRGVPGQPQGQMAQFTTRTGQKISMERNRMKYSAKRLLAEIRAFIQLYRDEIKTKSFKELISEANKLNEKTPLVRLRMIHRRLEEEIIDYYQKGVGLRLGVIVDPAAIGLNVAQLQGVLQPNQNFAGGGEVVRQLANAAQAGRPEAQAEKVVDVHYHLGGMAAATRAMLPEAKNIDKRHNERERIKLVKQRTNRIVVPQEATRRYLYQDRRRPYIPENIKIRSKKC